jgi:hypothetical protein
MNDNKFNDVHIRLDPVIFRGSILALLSSFLGSDNTSLSGHGSAGA